MMTHRHLPIAVVLASVAALAVALADKGPVMGSTAFEWNSISVKPTDVGSVRAFFRQRTATVDQLEVHVTTLEPGIASHPPHRHPNEEMVIVKQGTVEVLIDGQWKRVGPGSVVFFASNQLHALRNVGSDEAIYHVINWKTRETPEEPLP